MSQVAGKNNLFISVVLPAYNEEQTIGREIDVIREAMSTTSYEYEIIIVDDGSKDRTAEIAEERGVRVIRHGKNLGGGVARNTGILEARGEIIVASDADGTYPHQDIPKMLSYFPDYDMVIGARTGLVVEEPWHRSLPKWFIRRLACRLSGIEIPDLNTGFRAFKKDVARLYFSLFPRSHSWASTITLCFLCNGHRVLFMPINYFKRKGGKSTFSPIADTYNYIVLTVRTIMYFNPLRVFLPLGFWIFFIGAVKTVWDWIFHRQIGGLDVFIMVTSINVVILAFIADLLTVQHRRREPTA